MNTVGSGTADAVNTFTDTNGLTWHLIQTVVANGSLRRLTQYWAEVTGTPGAGTATADFNGVTQTSCYIHISEYAGLNNAAPIGNLDTKNPSGTATSLALALTFGSVDNGTYFFIGTATTATMTVANGQLITENNVNSPTTRILAGWDSVNQTAPGATWVNAAARWGAGFELVAAAANTVATAGTITPAGALTNAITQIPQAVAGTITPAGAITGLVVTSPTTASGGTITPAGELTELAIGVADMVGVVTPTGALTLQITAWNVIVANDLVLSGELQLQVNKTLAGTITPQGVVDFPTNFKTIGGTITPAGALVAVAVTSEELPAGHDWPHGPLTGVNHWLGPNHWTGVNILET